ncbi:hypothetical protein T4A_8263 [Trichinella pseudospiralis]|uniref:Uncharacterized protein n=1 Tax=Trichinella pseudospiralis TaxID=6337 RepID=A0A0V1CH49_TRIPS|nr:hypothetical protein T4A_8263 [Trichinella pseudospiralis]KRZ00028.1 hypothetical protein T4C_9325 [Trichinella pseudospiralis]
MLRILEVVIVLAGSNRIVVMVNSMESVDISRVGFDQSRLDIAI